MPHACNAHCVVRKPASIRKALKCKTIGAYRVHINPIMYVYWGSLVMQLYSVLAATWASGIGMLNLELNLLIVLLVLLVAISHICAAPSTSWP